MQYYYNNMLFYKINEIKIKLLPEFLFRKSSKSSVPILERHEWVNTKMCDRPRLSVTVFVFAHLVYSTIYIILQAIQILVVRFCMLLYARVHCSPLWPWVIGKYF